MSACSSIACKRTASTAKSRFCRVLRSVSALSAATNSGGGRDGGGLQAVGDEAVDALPFDNAAKAGPIDATVGGGADRGDAGIGGRPDRASHRQAKFRRQARQHASPRSVSSNTQKERHE
jgi:hypothetical protein